MSSQSFILSRDSDLLKQEEIEALIDYINSKSHHWNDGKAPTFNEIVRVLPHIAEFVERYHLSNSKDKLDLGIALASNLLKKNNDQELSEDETAIIKTSFFVIIKASKGQYRLNKSLDKWLKFIASFKCNSRPSISNVDNNDQDRKVQGQDEAEEFLKYLELTEHYVSGGEISVTELIILLPRVAEFVERLSSGLESGEAKLQFGLVLINGLLADDEKLTNEELLLIKFLLSNIVRASKGEFDLNKKFNDFVDWVKKITVCHRQ